MLEVFYPRHYEVSTYVVPFDYYRAQGIQGVVFNVDNTLVPHNAPADEQTVEPFERLRVMGMKTCLPSSNKELRVKLFADLVGSRYIRETGKPGIRGYEKAMELMETGGDHIPFVGDRLLTDVYGANRAGVRSIPARPIDLREEIQIVLKRYLRKPMLYFYKKHAKDTN